MPSSGCVRWSRPTGRRTAGSRSVTRPPSACRAAGSAISSSHEPDLDAALPIAASRPRRGRAGLAVGNAGGGLVPDLRAPHALHGRDREPPRELLLRTLPLDESAAADGL